MRRYRVDWLMEQHGDAKLTDPLQTLAELPERLARPASMIVARRAARALVELDQANLARRAVVSTDTIADFENGSRIPAANALAAIRAALEFGGVIFIDGDEPGVKLRKRRR
jgi:hypothetical protein